MQIMTRAKQARAPHTNGKVHQIGGPSSNSHSGGNGKNGSNGTFTTNSGFKFKAEPGRSANGKATARKSDKGKRFDSPLFRKLSPQLQEQSQSQGHLWDYLCSLPIDDIGIPEYHPQLSRSMGDIQHRNLIYPVDNGTFVHLHPDVTDSRDYYMSVAPSINPNLTKLMEQVDRHLIDYVDELKRANDAQERTKVLLQCLDQICKVKGSRRQGGMIPVTEKEMQGLRYMMVRDKEGVGAIEPLINDPYIEDISCSGVGPLFVEHKIFGGLKADISFDTTEELDRYVIKLSEKIGRPVTVRDPIVDAILPDGSRVNIVYGGDVSKRGSNFTIRKFGTTPMSILDLVDMGTLSYEMVAYISLMVGEGMNTFVSGETASGKTTFMNAITTFINPNAKIVSIEDTPELQVPHPNWTREVVRGGNTSNASITMFDLLKTSLRQRPNEIIIGEIRGEEGSVAFQAMQTGHACMATFHAASVEKLIQRITGSPINVPKPYLDNLNLATIMSAVRLPDGRAARRVLSINEIIGYDSQSDSFGFIEVFRWNPENDTFEFPGYMNTNLLEHVVALRRGIAPRNSRQIYQELEDRANILRKLHDRNITNFYELHSVLTRAYRQGLFR